MVDSLQDRKMEDDLNSFPEDTTYCSVVVLRDYVSLLRFPLDTAALQSMVVVVRSQIDVDFPQFRLVNWNHSPPCWANQYFFPPCCFLRNHQSFPEGNAGLQHRLNLVPRIREIFDIV